MTQHVAVLTDGPAAGERVPVELTDRHLPPRTVEVDVPVLDETAETFHWARARYWRLQLLRARRPGDPWAYFHVSTR